jgi:hypothetical protein
MLIAIIGAGVAGLPGVAGAQDSACNALYDDGTAIGSSYFGGGKAGDPDYMFAVLFDLDDFGHDPGKVEITALCAANQIGVYEFVYPNEVFIYPDNDGAPDDSVVLGHGTIFTGNGLGEHVVILDEPVVLSGDFWLVSRGYEPLELGTFNMDTDAEPDSGHSFLSRSGIEDLEPSESGDWMLRANLQPTDRSYLVAGMAHTEGLGSTQWRSKLGLLNTSDLTTSATVTYVRRSGSTSVNLTLMPGELLAWDDVAEDLFGAGESSGAIRVDADGSVIVTGRTYNQGSSGTFGQYLPGTTVAEALTSGQTGVLSQLTKNSSFRTNIGCINLGNMQCEVSITLRDATGTPVGNTRTLTIAPSGWEQDTDIFAKAGAGEQANGYATIEVLTEGCTVWGYGSVVDEGTGDPTTIPITVQ